MQTAIVQSPKRGMDVTILCREDTSDLSTVGSSFWLWGQLVDEYRLAQLPELTGTAIDIGAHIGTVGLALLADHPELRVTFVEPLPDNLAMIRRNLDANAWTDRATVIDGAIAKGKTAHIAWDFGGPDYLRNHRYIGGLLLGRQGGDYQTLDVVAVRLSKLVDGSCPFLKVDCEGCEFDLFADKAIARVERIVGEGHPKDWLARVHRALDATHDVEVLSDEGGPGTFRAVRR